MSRYVEMLVALAGAGRFGVRLGLEAMTGLGARLGDPQRRMGAIVHVGGTNGKGSTAAFVEAALRRAGWRTGLYTSPHRVRFTERIRIDGVEIDRERCAALHARMLAAGGGELTFFEQITAMGFLAFAEAGTEVVVLEVGLGGRLDATNIVDAEVGVVSGVGLDHTEVLGPTIADIAVEKAGIFKPGRIAVIGAGGAPEGVPVLETEARRRGAGEVILAPAEPPAGWTVGLAGPHQRRNAATALAALAALERVTGRAVPEAARRAGLAEVVWPCRLEELPGGVIVDGAHNPQGAAALAAALGGRKHAVVLGVSAGKDAAGILAALAPGAEAVVVTQAPSARALAAHEVGPGLLVEPIIEPDYKAAVERARALAPLVVVTGSIFLAGAVRAWLLGEESDPVVAQDPAAAVAAR